MGRQIKDETTTRTAATLLATDWLPGQTAAGAGFKVSAGDLVAGALTTVIGITSADVTLTDSDNLSTLDNAGATAHRTVVLPSAVSGLRFCFIKSHPVWNITIDVAAADRLDGAPAGVNALVSTLGMWEIACLTDGSWTTTAISEKDVTGRTFNTLTPATYYISPSGVDSAAGTSGAPRKTLRGGMALCKPGDILILRNGTYSDATLDALDGATMCRGTSYRWVTIQAENVGAAIITATLNINASMSPSDTSYERRSTACYYVKFDGIVWNSAVEKQVTGRYLVFKRCGFRGAETATTNKSTVAIGSGGNGLWRMAQDMLFEDCWAWGPGGRKRFQVYNAARIVMRRCVARWDDGYTGADNKLDFDTYDSEDIVWQNCISVDSTKPGAASVLAAFDVTANYLVTRNIRFEGCLVINNRAQGFGIGRGLSTFSVTRPTGMSSSLTGKRLVPEDILVRNCAIVKHGESGLMEYSRGISVYSGRNVSIENNLIALADNFTDYISVTSPSVSQNVRCANNVSILGAAGGNHATVTTETRNTNHLTYANAAAGVTAGMTYPCRAESASTIQTADGGPTIILKYGMDGTLYGEPGYDSVATDGAASDLWPFPNEATIKTLFSAAGGFGDSDRDWTAGADSLTDYVWKALGSATGLP